MFDHLELHWKWPIKDYVYFDKAEYVHPYQQYDVQYMLGKAEQNPHIKLLVLFGSSVTSRCNKHSDIDVYLETDDGSEPRMEFMPMRVGVDNLYNFTDGDWKSWIGREIERNGIILLDRRDNG